MARAAELAGRTLPLGEIGALVRAGAIRSIEAALVANEDEVATGDAAPDHRTGRKGVEAAGANPAQERDRSKRDRHRREGNFLQVGARTLPVHHEEVLSFRQDEQGRVPGAGAIVDALFAAGAKAAQPTPCGILRVIADHHQPGEGLEREEAL